MTINKPKVAKKVGCIRVIFKIVGSRDAAVKATDVFMPHLEGHTDTTCDMFIVIPDYVQPSAI
jgi:hypothetical protein